MSVGEWAAVLCPAAVLVASVLAVVASIVECERMWFRGATYSEHIDLGDIGDADVRAVCISLWQHIEDAYGGSKVPDVRVGWRTYTLANGHISGSKVTMETYVLALRRAADLATKKKAADNAAFDRVRVAAGLPPRAQAGQLSLPESS